MTASIDTEEPDRTHRSGDGAEDFPEAVVDRVAHAIGKPRVRGWIHVYSAVVALIAGRDAGVGVLGDGGDPGRDRDAASTR